MYYNNILQIIINLTNVIGTIYAVLSILQLKSTDLYKSITIDGMDKNDNSLLVQRSQARMGVSLIIYAWISQCIVMFLDITSWKIFTFCIVLYILILIAVCVIIYLLNLKFRKNYIKFRNNKSNAENDRHIESHTWHEF